MQIRRTCPAGQAGQILHPRENKTRRAKITIGLQIQIEKIKLPLCCRIQYRFIPLLNATSPIEYIQHYLFL